MIKPKAPKLAAPVRHRYEPEQIPPRMVDPMDSLIALKDDLNE